jgi:dihydropteroate synthase
MYTDKFVTNTFERNAFCATADYAKIAGGISVHNVQVSQRHLSAIEAIREYTGPRSFHHTISGCHGEVFHL